MVDFASSPSLIEWDLDGECFVLGGDRDSQALHAHRYLAALNLVGGKDVLDLAEGKGSGAWFLAQAARTVTGIDVSARPAAPVQAHRDRPNLRYLDADGRALPLADHSVDVVTSFDVRQGAQDAILREIRRVLRPGGLVLMSMSHAVSSQAACGTCDPRSAAQTAHEAFSRLMRGHFSHVALYDQGLTQASIIWPGPGEATLGEMAPAPWLQARTSGVARTGHMSAPAFVIAVASDGPLEGIGGIFQAAAAAYPDLRDTLAVRDTDLQKVEGLRLEEETAISSLKASVASLSQALENAQRRPHKLMARLLKFRVLSMLSKARFLPTSMTRRFARSAEKRDPGRIDAAFLWKGKRSDEARPPEETARWIFAQQQAELTPVTARARIGNLSSQPLVSIIMPVYDTPVQWLRRAIESLQEQFYENWELCVVDDCSPTAEPRQLLEEMAKDDPRIRVAEMPWNGGISAASNLSLEMARGEFIALVDHDDEITPDALLRMVEAINANSRVDFLYSDECKICDTPERKLFDFALKPDWSPEFMLNFMITGHLTLYRTDLVRKIGGFRSAYDLSQDYDLALRMSEVSRSIVHVERILYLWRAIAGSAASGGKVHARGTNVSALADMLKRRKIPAIVEAEEHANRVRVAIPPTGARVSIVIPSDSANNLRLAIDAIRQRTDYDAYEVCVVCNSTVADDLEREYRDWVPARFVRYDKPYNFSDKCNVGAKAAEGDIVVFYNDDVYPIGRDWIERLIEYLWLPGVGATSPQLLYEDGTIQYAGMISGTPGLAGTAFHRLPLNHVDSFLSMNRLVRNVSILSGACCAMRRDLFWEVGGFDTENTPDGHSDLDLSYKIIAAGKRCVYTPYALLTHVGKHSWNTTLRRNKADVFCLKRWGRYVSRDPYFTETMCRVLYTDFTFEYRIHAEYIDPAVRYSGPDVLFVSHEMTHTGAPHMLLGAARAVKAAGGFPVVVSPTDGPLRQAFEEAGIAVLIDASVNQNHFLFERFARNFDLAVVNTSTLTPVVKQLAKLPNLRTLWWLHESQLLSKNLKGVAPEVWKRVRAICVSNYAKSYLPSGLEATILFNGLPDQVGSIIPSSTVRDPDKLVFLMLGTMEPRKGQDLFVEAILGLPEAVRSGCRFVMAGKQWKHDRPFWEPLQERIADQVDIAYLGSVSAKEALELIAGCDILVSCSRDDAFALVAIEAAQMGKPAILSDHVGAREVLDDRCSFVFPSGDVESLRARIVQAYEDRPRIEEMGRAARGIYEERLIESVFAKNFMMLVQTEIARSRAFCE